MQTWEETGGCIWILLLFWRRKRKFLKWLGSEALLVLHLCFGSSLSRRFVRVW